MRVSGVGQSFYRSDRERYVRICEKGRNSVNLACRVKNKRCKGDQKMSRKIHWIIEDEEESSELKK